MYVPTKFGDSRSNGFRDIRGADFVSNERLNERTLPKPIPIAQNAIAFRLKNTNMSNVTKPPKCIAYKHAWEMLHKATIQAISENK